VVWTGRARGFTLAELIIVIAVLAVLAGVLVPVFGQARESAKLSGCMANLSQIATAAKMYHEDHGGPPLVDLPVALADYVDSGHVFRCPKDKPGSLDSYSEFFVPRKDPKGDQFVIGCPRHRDASRVGVVFGKMSTEADRVASASWNGQPIRPGDTVTGGEMRFSDNSRVTIPDDMTVGMLCSFNTQGRLYSIVWVPQGQQGRLDCEVTPGSKFEVVTPAAIAGVQGTKFSVWVYRTAGYRDATMVRVTQGAVVLKDRVSGGSEILPPGKAGVVTEYKVRDPEFPKWGKIGKRWGRHHDSVQ
jgi:prepilin-type N-terminal cleavage/methylation domain-containing protein